MPYLAEKIVETLEYMKSLGQPEKHAPEFSGVGICFYLKYRYKVITHYAELASGFRTWPKSTGYAMYPISLRGEEGDNYFSWDKDTYYGKLRWELIDHMIEHFKKEMKEEDGRSNNK